MIAAVTEPCLDAAALPLLGSPPEGGLRKLVITLDMQAHAASRKKASAWRLAFTLFLLFSFTAQSYLVQTHLHDINQRALTAALSGDFAHHPAKDGKYPSIPDEKDCPLCRLAAHISGLVVPIIELVLPVTFVVLPQVFIPTTVVATRPHPRNWQIRAPPR